MKTLASIMILLFCSTGSAELLDRAGLLDQGTLIAAGFELPGTGQGEQEAPETALEGEFCQKTFVCCQHSLSMQSVSSPEFQLPPDPRTYTVFGEIQTPPPRA